MNREMTDGQTAERTKIGVAVYLPTCEMPDCELIASDFQKRWGGAVISCHKQSNTMIDFRVIDSSFSMELCGQPIPAAVTEAALKVTRHWPRAESELATHTAHIAVAGSPDRNVAVAFACDLTRLLCSLLSVSNAIGLCWLNGPVLASTHDFIAMASEMFGRNMLPCFLWIAAIWNPKACMIHTMGMDQFGRADIFLGAQSAPPNIGYLFELVNYLLNSGKDLLDGETVEGPQGVLSVQRLEGKTTNKAGALLLPARIN